MIINNMAGRRAHSTRSLKPSKRIESIIRRRMSAEAERHDNVRKTIGIILIAVLMFAAILLIRPFVISILTAAVLAYLFHPIYLKIDSKLKKPNISALIICFGIILILILCVIIITNFAIKEVLDFYTYSKTHDITAPVKTLLLRISPAGSSTSQITSIFDQAIEKGTTHMFDTISNTIINLPMILLQIFIIFFVMFYFLKEGTTLIKYSKNILPFRESVREKFLQRFRIIMHGFVHGTIVVGLVQGLCAGIAFFVVGVSQPFMLTALATLGAIIPFIGAWIAWLPVSLGLIIKGSTMAGIGLLLYGTIFVSWIDNFLRPVVVGKITKMPNAIVMIGMLGGLQVFGVIGLVIGPIILDSVLVIIDMYKTKQIFIR